MLRIAVVAIGQSRVSEWAGGSRCDASVLLLQCHVLIHRLRSCVLRYSLLNREEHSIMCFSFLRLHVFGGTPCRRPVTPWSLPARFPLPSSLGNSFRSERAVESENTCEWVRRPTQDSRQSVEQSV